MIQPDGKVDDWVDLTGILAEKNCSGKIAELNGIAYYAAQDSIYVTGKYGCKLLEIKSDRNILHAKTYPILHADGICFRADSKFLIKVWGNS